MTQLVIFVPDISDYCYFIIIMIIVVVITIAIAIAVSSGKDRSCSKM